MRGAWQGSSVDSTFARVRRAPDSTGLCVGLRRDGRGYQAIGIDEFVLYLPRNWDPQTMREDEMFEEVMASVVQNSAPAGSPETG